MIHLVIDGLPVSWKAHAGYGRKSFNPRFREKEFYQWQIKSQWNKGEPFRGPVHLEMDYHLPVPVGSSKIRKQQMLANIIRHTKRPDLDNFDKFLSDCLIGIVIEDDSQICEKSCKKIYSEHSQTIVRILLL